MEFQELIRKRYSCRAYLDDVVSDEPDMKFTGLTEGEVEYWLDFFNDRND